MALRWAHILTGEVATCALLLAAVQHKARRVTSGPWRLAMQWAQLHFDQSVARALSGTPAESVLSDAETITCRMAAYADTIGDIEQTLAGEDDNLDELLQKQQTETSSDVALHTNLPIYTARVSVQPMENGKAEPLPPDSSRTAELIQTWIEMWLAKKLRIDANALDPRRPFADYGLDSVTAVELALELEERLAVAVEVTVVWSFPTIEALSHHLASELSVPEAASQARPEQRSEMEKELSSEVKQLSQEQVEASIAQEVAELENFLSENRRE
jgi:acyl carrier protein